MTETETTELCRQAITAIVQWFDAERMNLGSFHDRMELCNYAEWLARKAAGQDVGEYHGIPKITIHMFAPEVPHD